MKLRQYLEAVDRIGDVAARERLLREMFVTREERLMPITKENLNAAFSYHGLDDDQKRAYERIQEAAEAFALVVLDVLPPCGDQQAAIRHIFEAKATANRGVAVKGMV